MISALSSSLAGARFSWSVPRFLRHPVTLMEARAAVGRRRERREVDFLDIARRGIYENPASPYRRLLALAGCEYGDLERLVRRDGVEGAMLALLRRGVYVTVEEFKGRRPIARPGLTYEVGPEAFQNPRTIGHVPAQSGGSRSPGTAILMNLDFIRDCAMDTLLLFHARGGLGWHMAQWQVPGSGVIARLLEYASFGPVPERWFSHIDPAAPGIHPRYRWSARLLRMGGRLAGRHFPRPEHVSVDAPLPIARWMASVLEAGGTPHLHTFVSSAVRLCRAAGGAGIDLRGAKFMVTGEPLTRTQRAVIEDAGGEVTVRYGIVECGVVGFGCLGRGEADEVHFVDDLHALVQSDSDGIGLPPRTLLLSSLRPAAPLILLNVSMGDQAVAESAPCACPVEAIGWTRRLHTIRSREKLTAGGMTFLDVAVVRVLEEVLPARFGGHSTDYQLVEEHGGDGALRLRLLVHPRVGVVDESAVSEAFLSAVGTGAGAEPVMSLVWRDARLFRVERRPPLVTASGKILHLHVQR
jgi:hypothetical protein